MHFIFVILIIIGIYGVVKIIEENTTDKTSNTGKSICDDCKTRECIWCSGYCPYCD